MNEVEGLQFGFVNGPSAYPNAPRRSFPTMNRSGGVRDVRMPECFHLTTVAFLLMMRFAYAATNEKILEYMRSNSTNASGRRSRRHPRRRSDRRDSNNPAGSTSKPTWWQKIISLFSGAPKKRPQQPERPRERDRSDDRDYASTPRVSRKPEVVDVTTPRLYVGNLSFDATESDLTELFNGVGQVVTAEVVSHRHTQRSKGFAFVQMQSVEEALRAVRELHDKEFLGRKLVVSGAKTPEGRRETAEPNLAS